MPSFTPTGIFRRWGLFYLALIGCFASPACSQPNRNKITLSDSPETEKTLVTAVTSSPLTCLPVLGSGRVANKVGQGHHKVLFRWNASAPSPHPENNAVGYCLYRSKFKGLPKKNPRCSQCELVNSAIIPAADNLACVDDQVADDTTYYYVATAIDKNRNLSPTSNEIPVTIPAASQHTGNSIPHGIISCRDPGKTWDQP